MSFLKIKRTLGEKIDPELTQCCRQLDDLVDIEPCVLYEFDFDISPENAIRNRTRRKIFDIIKKHSDDFIEELL